MSHFDFSENHRLSKFTPPSIKAVEDFARPMQFYFRPQYFGIDELNAEKPALYVTNHTTYGLTDGLLFGLELYKRRNIFLRPLVDNLHFEVPVWKNWISKFGFVRASRENCAALMQAGENILVFPGGGRETCKRKGESYRLVWRDHVGFCRMAIQHGYDIIPVAQVGGDDAYKIIADADDIMQSWLGRFLQNTKLVKEYLHGGDYIPPLTTGLFGIPGIPKPVKYYIAFGERVDTSRFLQKFDDDDNLWQLRDEVELMMNKLFISMLEYRKSDKKGLLNLLT